MKLSFRTTFKPNYLLSTKMNLKCFPNCGETHMEKTFCGRGVEITLNTDAGRVSYEDVTVFSEIKDASDKILKIGDWFESHESESKYFKASFSYYESDGSGMRFMFPKGHWKSPEDIRDKMFNFVCYLVVDNRVVDMAVSSTFSLSGTVHKKRKPKVNTAAEEKQNSGKRIRSSSETENNDRKDNESSSNNTSFQKIELAPVHWNFDNKYHKYNWMMIETPQKQQQPSSIMMQPRSSHPTFLEGYPNKLSRFFPQFQSLSSRATPYYYFPSMSSQFVPGAPVAATFLTNPVNFTLGGRKLFY